MRTTLIAAALLFCAACADSPITAGDLEADGQLRESRQSNQQQVLEASEVNLPQSRHAARLSVTGVLAAQSTGALEDATEFSIASEAVYLHLRADGLQAPRPVTFVWSHGEQRRETMGFLQPSETLSMAASLPLASFLEAAELAASERDARAELAEPELGPADAAGQPAPPEAISPAGRWTLEVYASDRGGRSLLFERDFEVTPLAGAESASR